MQDWEIIKLPDPPNIYYGSNPGGIGGDDSFTKLLLHCNGADGSTVFTDVSLSSHGNATVIGSAQVDTAQFKFASGSLLCASGGGNYLTYADNADWELGTNAFTIDFWVRFNGVAANNGLVAKWTAGGANRSWLLYFVSTSILDFIVSNDGATAIDHNFSWNPSLNTWYHVAISRSSQTLRAFINGTQIGTSLSSTENYFNSTAPLAIGGWSDGVGYLNGWMDELRISNGIARWTSNFTPPDEPYGIYLRGGT